ncbi:fungal-specific transcription factor domain-containing protein [Xylariaceae sp. FL0255]|nr:fungal-specific transcription factor domain-containing protein [Xylariaceae sp. FL0255]
MTVSGPPQSNNKDAQAARKRRRRAPAGGAADDCFACIKRNSKCDRRRPYCSQCLEIGNECSGYKTQLTWGVGVASRGKLRGLSLPIAKAPPVAPVTKKSITRARAASTATNASQWSDTDDATRRSPHREGIEINVHHASIPSTPYTPYPDYARFPHEPASAVSHTQWGSLPAYTSHMSAHEPPKFHKLNTAVNHYPLVNEPLSSSVDSLSDVDYTLSPAAHSFPREEMPFMHSPIMYEGYPPQHSPVSHTTASAIMIDQRAAPTSCPSLVYAPSEHSSSLGSHHDAFEPRMGHRLMPDSDTLSVPELVDSYSTSPHSTVGPFWPPSHTRDDDMTQRHAMEPTPALPQLSYESHTLQVSPDLIAKMPFFMDYYENIMCPSLVLIDGPKNPYRDHILRLASSSRSLQHAICALSACNLRMKRRLSLGQHTRDSQLTTENGGEQAATEDRSLAEEHEHRNLAVNLLNLQLNDPSKSCHDSVLATILLLCHYRMVESGVAKFQTQFAGVKKILSMRKSVHFQGTAESAWMETVFTYCDSISASINDREAQLTTSFFGLPSDANLLPPGAENLVGCDRELFKTISKLGRLNLMSQNRQVQSQVSTPRGHDISAFSPVGSPLGHTFKQDGSNFFSTGQPRFDGNGFVTKIEEDELSSSAFDDHRRSGFWAEWKEAHTALQTWEFDAQRTMASLPSSATQSQIRDVNFLSEAFRYAALLYIERLAAPTTPSNHNNFRNLVSQVVYYATSLEAGSSAEKFLLWPLFVAGSECINELQQNIIRNKCRDIMARSGYMSNMAAIDVLERLWQTGGSAGSSSDPLTLGRSPFNWTKCISGNGVENEWIMF